MFSFAKTVQYALKFSLLTSVLSVVFLLTSLCHAQTEIEGEVSGVWTAEDSPFVIVGGAIIHEDDTLIIEPGVVVEFEREGTIELNGSLFANGTEEDSIIFTGEPDYYFIFNELDTSYTSLIHLNCVRSEIKGSISGAYGDFSILNSSLYTFNVNISVLGIIKENVFDLEYIAFDEVSSGIRGPADTVIFRDNIMNNLSVGFLNLSDFVIENNVGDANSVIVGTCDSVTFNNNHGFKLNISGIGHLVDGNTLTDLKTSSWGNRYSVIDITNNDIDGFCSLFRMTHSMISNNRISEAIEILNCRSLEIDHNIVYEQYGRSALQAVSNTVMTNNTFLDRRIAHSEVGYKGFEDCELINNIFSAESQGGTAFEDEYEFESDYNCFFGFDSIFVGEGELGEHDITDDPKLVGGNPFSVDLRYDSPCIDTGDPDSGIDPDSTNREIGASFFDQRIDHAPAIISNWWDYASRRNIYSYEAKAVDDGEDLTFTFQNLPEWLRVNRRDGIEESIQISGVVPNNQEDFTFSVKVEDDSEQVDTLSVSVSCYEGTIISGSISGEFTVEESPYVVTDHIWIEPESTLVIHEGVDIKFLRKSIYAFDADEINFTISGSLLIRGSNDSRVVLTPDSSSFPAPDYPNYWLYVDNADTIQIENANIYCWNLDIRNTEYLNFNNCILPDINTQDVGTLLISESTLPSVYGSCDSTEIVGNRVDNSYTNYPEYSPNHGGIIIHNAQRGVINDNVISNCGLWRHFMPFNGPALSLGADFIEISRNLIYNNGIGISFGADSGCVSSNTISYSNEDGINGRYNENGKIVNNLVYGADEGLWLSMRYGSYQINNNIIFADYGENVTSAPESVGLLDRVNVNGDSTDEFGNIFSFPELIMFGPRLFAPNINSAAVDAGNDELPDDPDGSRADIGYWILDHDNETPEFELTRLSVPQLPNFWTVAGMSVNDFDTDSVHYRWIADGVTFGSGVIRDDIYNQEVLDSTVFTESREYRVSLQVTDGNSMVFRDFIITVGNSAIEEKELIPDVFTVGKAYPNPFNSTCLINIHLVEVSDISISIYDLTGRKVLKENLKKISRGEYKYMVDGRSLSTGTYFLYINDGRQDYVQQLTLLK